ncbi:hypothetical protein [Thermoactinospora rubra]|uniref:hypothetical protein n=1 Tax=Thermoactinospora rubra TaxID=1088767 RepID=UPI00197EDC88|nr:hypothetical protein [Thermoactinospora rubra]
MRGGTVVGGRGRPSGSVVSVVSAAEAAEETSPAARCSCSMSRSRRWASSSMRSVSRSITFR